jgi:hypothetical protein
MLNLELARIVIAERRRTTDENLRQAGFRQALADRIDAQAAVDPRPLGTNQACTDSGQQAKPALS